MTQTDCEEEKAKAEAHRTQQQQAEADARQRRESAVEADRQAVIAKTTPVHGQCGDAAVVTANIALIPAPVTPETRAWLTEHFRAERESARDRRWRAVSKDVLDGIQAGSGLSELSMTAELDEAITKIADVRAHLVQVRCTGEDAYDGLPELQAKVEAWAVPLEDKIAAERKCRASDECLADRLAKPLCSALDDKRTHVDAMARERANPSGYVNKTALHDLGQAMQDDDDHIAAARKEYAQATKKPFSAARCTKPK